MVHFQDDVALLQASLGARAVGPDLPDHDTLVALQVELAGDVRRDLADLQAPSAARLLLAVRAGQLADP